MSGGYEIQPAPAPMKKVEKQARSYTPISMITSKSLSPSMPTETLISRKIGLSDTPVIRTIYIDPDVDNDNDEIVYDSDGDVGPPYEQVEDKGDLNTQEEELVDTRIGTKTTVQVDENNASPELTLAATTTVKVKVIKGHLKAIILSVQGNKPDVLLRLRQEIESNVLIVTDLDPNILDNMAGTGFAPMAHWEVIVPKYSDVMTEERA